MRVYRVEIYEYDPKALFDIWHVQADDFESAFEKTKTMVAKFKIKYNIKSITEILVLNS